VKKSSGFNLLAALS